MHPLESHTDENYSVFEARECSTNKIKIQNLEREIDPVWWPFPNKISGAPSHIFAIKSPEAVIPTSTLQVRKTSIQKKKIWKFGPSWVEILRKSPRKNIIGKSVNDRLITPNDKGLSAKLIFSFVGRTMIGSWFLWGHQKGFYDIIVIVYLSFSQVCCSWKRIFQFHFSGKWNFALVKNIKLCLKHFLYVRHTWLTLFARWSGSHSSREVWRVRSVRRGRKVKRAKNVRRMRKGRRRVSCGRRDVKFSNI